MNAIAPAVLDEGLAEPAAKLDPLDLDTSRALDAGLQDRINAAAKAMTEAGVPYRAQVRVIGRVFMLSIGGGGGGFNAGIRQCPWCGAYGGGGHGGFCPGPSAGY